MISRIKTGAWRWMCALVVLGWLGCQSAPEPRTHEDPNEGQRSRTDAEQRNEAGPKRIILFVGDGMGLSYVAGASYVSGERLAMLGMDEFRLLTTHGHGRVTTDSAASATALATGEKTHFQGVSVRPGTGPENEGEPARQMRTLAGAANENGWKSGLISTVRINHATPGPFAAHRHIRHAYEDIALDMSQYEVDLLLGAGADFFEDRADERNLFEEMNARGYAVARNAEEVRTMAAIAPRLVGLMVPRDMAFVDGGERPMSLAEMVSHGLAVLDRENEDGFVLMVEGALIDWAGHAMDGERGLRETLDFDSALAVALQYARGRQDTLVVVTADHETGAMDIVDRQEATPFFDRLGGEEAIRNATIPDEIFGERRSALRGPFAGILLPEDPEFGARGADELITSFGYLSPASRAYWDGARRFSAIHTPEMVPLFAEGPGARELMSVTDNADLGRRLMSFVDGEFVTGEAVGDDEPENVIVVVADGLGVAALTAGYYHFGSMIPLQMDRQAVVATHSHDRLVGDLASTATALASGERTSLGMIGLRPGHGGSLVPTGSALVEAGRSGRRTGIVTTAALTHPTVAAFYGQQASGQTNGLGEQLVALADHLRRPWGIDLLIGQGEFIDASMRVALEAQGYRLFQGFQAQDEGGAEIHLLEGGEAGSTGTRLEKLADYALGRLTGEEGFFLLIEAGKTGRAIDTLDRGPGVMEGLAELNRVMARVLEYAELHGDTLVLLTTGRDHTMTVLDNHYGFHQGFCGAVADCGGPLSLEWMDVAAERITHGDGIGPGEHITVQYSYIVEEARRLGLIATGMHSANFVPLFASGPGAAAFGGFLDQPEIGRWLMRWAGGRGENE